MGLDGNIWASRIWKGDIIQNAFFVYCFPCPFTGRDFNYFTVIEKKEADRIIL
jgi:hypothetical protein